MIGLLLLARAAALPPGFSASLFAPGVISTPLGETGGTFSPDGRDFYFAVRTPTTSSLPLAAICVSHRREGRWTPPVVVPFSGRGYDYGPALDVTGTRMLFTTARSQQGDALRGDTDLWIVRKKRDGSWSDPTRLPEPINSSSNEQGASIAPDGSLYFSSDRDGGPGSMDIYRAAADGKGGWTEPRIVRPVSSKFADTMPFVSRDGRYLFFVSLGRPADFIAGGAPYAKGDIWVSRREGHGWSAPVQLGRSVNTPASETFPFLSPDGHRLFFTSEISGAIVPLKTPMGRIRSQFSRTRIFNGGGNLYSIPLAKIDLRHGTWTFRQASKRQ